MNDSGYGVKVQKINNFPCKFCKEVAIYECVYDIWVKAINGPFRRVIYSCAKHLTDAVQFGEDAILKSLDRAAA